MKTATLKERKNQENKDTTKREIKTTRETKSNKKDDKNH